MSLTRLFLLISCIFYLFHFISFIYLILFCFILFGFRAEGNSINLSPNKPKKLVTWNRSVVAKSNNFRDNKGVSKRQNITGGTVAVGWRLGPHGPARGGLATVAAGPEATKPSNAPMADGNQNSDQRPPPLYTRTG